MKVFLKNIYLTMFTIIMILSFSTISFAEESLSIPKWQIESQLLGNGDLSITEDITFRFNDKFNGVFREILLEKTSGIQDINVAEVTEGSESQYKRVNDAKKGDSGVFVVIQDADVDKVQIFSPSRDEQKTFRISYTVKNVAIRYNDIGELYYKFLGSENETPIDSFTVEVRLPQNDVNDEVKIFAHGPLNGNITRKTNNIVYMQVKDVPKGTFIEGRVLFPKDFILNSNNLVDKNNYKNILDEEASFQKKIEEKAAKNVARSNLFGNISFVISAFEIIIFVLLLSKFRREKNIYEITRSNAIPEDCTPAVASYLVTMTDDSNTIIATILDLFRKGYIEIDGGQEYTMKRKKLRDFTITRVKEDDVILLNHEKHFMHWILDEIGDGKSVTTRDIEKYSKDNDSGFQSSYYDWQKKIKEDAIKKGYFDKSSKKYAGFLIIISSITLVFSLITLGFKSLFGLILLGTSILLLIYGITLYSRKSDYGYSQYKKWLEFKKHMNEYKNYNGIDDLTKYPLDISLIYALGLGIDKKVIKKFNINKAYNNQSYYQSNGWLYWYFLFAHDKNNDFNKSINRSFSGTSSSTGSGGGFSGGGGGGAGGGGAGGF